MNRNERNIIEQVASNLLSRIDNEEHELKSDLDLLCSLLVLDNKKRHKKLIAQRAATYASDAAAASRAYEENEKKGRNS